MEWFRTYQTDVDDYVLQQLPAEVFRFYCNLKCLASNGDGVLPPLPAIMYRCHKTEAEVIEYLAFLADPGVDLLQELSPGAFLLSRWAKEQRVSDNSAPRVAKMREKQRVEALSKCGNNAVTLRPRYGNGLETETEKNKNTCASVDAGVCPAETQDVPPTTAKRQHRKNKAVSPLSPSQQERFDEFWISYWRKKDRLPAEWAYHDLIGDSEELHAGLLFALERDRREMLNRPEDKRPYGATYIHKQPWRDGNEPSPAQQTRTEKPATSFPREIYGAPEPMKRTAEEIELLREQAQDPCPTIREAALIALSEYQTEANSWKN